MHVTRILIELLCCIDIKKDLNAVARTHIFQHSSVHISCVELLDRARYMHFMHIIYIMLQCLWFAKGPNQMPVTCSISHLMFDSFTQPHVLQSHFSQRSCPLFIRSFMFQTLFSLLQLNFTHFWWFCYFCDRIRHVRNHFPPLMFRRLWKMIPCKILAI